MVLALALAFGLGLLVLLGFALRMVWVRTEAHFKTADDLGRWMVAHQVDRVVVRHGRLTVAERTAPAPPDAPSGEDVARGVEDDVENAFSLFAAEQRKSA
jgi:hypothetical protein